MRVTRPIGDDILHALYLLGGRSPEARLRALLTELRGPRPDSAYRVALHRLRADRLLFRARRASPAWVRLTPQGRARIALPPSRAQAPPAPAGMVYFVTYDVPVALNDVRDEFRRRLRASGWRRLHMSLWIAERDIRNTAMEAAEELAIESHVFVGTGALVKSHIRRAPTSRAEEVRREAAAIAARAGKDPAAAYRRWVAWTEVLRSWARASALDAALRSRWESATRDLGAVLGALGDAAARGGRVG